MPSYRKVWWGGEEGVGAKLLENISVLLTSVNVQEEPEFWNNLCRPIFDYSKSSDQRHTQVLLSVMHAFIHMSIQLYHLCIRNIIHSSIHPLLG